MMVLVGVRCRHGRGRATRNGFGYRTPVASAATNSARKRIFAIRSRPIPTAIEGKTIRHVVIFDNHPDNYPYYSYYPYDYYGYDDGYPYDDYDYSGSSPYSHYHGYAFSGQSSNGVVSAVQSKLMNLGYYHGAIDGVLGDQIQAALAQYQQDQDISVTGTVTSATLQALDLPYSGGY